MASQSPESTAAVDFEKPRRIGLGLLALVFGGFGLWSLTAPLDSAALAPGVVIVKSYKKTIQHLEGGIVKDIKVREGDRVASGDTLIVIDDTQTRASLDIAKANLFALLAKESRLLAERDGLEVVNGDGDWAAEPRMQAELLSQSQFFKARASARLGEIEVLNQRAEQLQANVEGLLALKRSKEDLVASFAEEIEDYRGLLEEGYADKVRLRELERSHSRLQGEVAEHSSAVAGTRIKIGEAKLEILQLEKRFHSDVIDELGQVQTALNDAVERVRALDDTVARSAIRSPVAGVAMNLQVHTVGAVISAGTPLLDVIPTGGDFLIEAQVSPNDVDRVMAGQTAKIRFTAFNSATPVIEGEVVTLSADRLINEMTGLPYFLARVKVTPQGVKDLAGLELMAGMSADVLIGTGSRTFFQYLLQPVSNAMARSLIED